MWKKCLFLWLSHITFFSIVFQVKGDFYRAEGEKVEPRVGKNLQEKYCPGGTWAQSTFHERRFLWTARGAVWSFVLLRQPCKFAGLKLHQRKDTMGLGRHFFSAIFAYFGFRMIIFFLQENLAIELLNMAERFLFRILLKLETKNLGGRRGWLSYICLFAGLLLLTTCWFLHSPG